MEAVQIDVLNPEAAIDLLSASVRGITREDWAPVAEWVGYLPLALELLNRAMKAGALTPGDLLTANHEGNATTKPLDDARLALREVVREDALPGVTQAFLLSYERLTHEQQTAARLLGWMAPSPIPRAVLEEFGSDSFPAAVRAVLRSRSFVTGVGDREGEYLGVMHRVLADFLLSQSAALEVEATHVTIALLESMVRVRGTGDAGLAHVRRCAPAIVSVLDHLVAQPRDDHSWINLVGTFGTRASGELSHWMLPDLTEAVLQRVVSFATIRLGEQHPNTLAVLNNLAATRHRRGDLLGAQHLFEVVLNSQRAGLGDEHANTLSTMHNLAGVYRGRGYLLRAKKIEEQVLERRRRTGDEHPSTLSTAINLASTLRELGELDSAESLLVGVIETMLRVLGADHPHTLTAMGNLANTKHARGDFTGARELQEGVLAGRQRTLGSEHSDTLDAMSNLALTLRKQGELAAATTLAEHILRVRERLLGRADEKTLYQFS